MKSPIAERRLRHMLPAAVIVALHVAGFFLLFFVIAPRRLELAGGGVFGIGLGLTAYALGARHAFDADHIAAIDNVTRRLAGAGRPSGSVGFCFSLGHSTVVLALGLAIALGLDRAGGALLDEGSLLNRFAGIWGPAVAGLFLLMIGLLNAVALRGIVRGLGSLRRGDEPAAAHHASHPPVHGPLARLFSRLTGSIERPWQMYPVGLLFGLGFDTASEIAMLVLVGGAGAAGLPFYSLLCLPLLFAAGMTFCDTLNTVLMRRAYGWALDRPLRRLYFNLTVTSTTVVSALTIGSLSLAGVAHDRLGVGGGAWSALASIDLAHAGYAMVAFFVLTWAAAAAVWRLGRFDAAAPRQSSAPR